MTLQGVLGTPQHMTEVTSRPEPRVETTETPATTTDVPASASPPGTPPLRRSRSNRVIAGVCGGFETRFGIDATLLRILVVVAAVLTNGALILAYLVAWVLMPEEPAGAGPAERTGESESTSGPGLGLLTMSSAAVVAGGLMLLGLTTVSVPASVVIASVTVVIGLGLVVGAWRGRARWLIFIAAGLLLATQGLMPVGGWNASTMGERTWQPTAVDEGPFALGMGSAQLDLTGVPDGSSEIDASVGMGELVVLVPNDVTVLFDGAVGLGDLTVLGEASNGGGLQAMESLPANVTPRATVDLSARVGVGNLEVRRVAP